MVVMETIPMVEVCMGGASTVANGLEKGLDILEMVESMKELSEGTK